MSELSQARHHFRLPDDVHFLNCAYMGPLPRAAEEAAVAAVRQKAVPFDIVADDFFSPSNEVRRKFVSLIGGGTPEDVAIVPSVSYGFATAARNLPVARGQNIVLLREQFPSNVYVWLRRAEETGAEVRFVEPASEEERASTGEGRGASWNRRILDAIDENTAVVSIGTIQWTDGTRFDLEAIGRRARAVGAAYLLDGSQSIGALPFNLEDVGADALIVAGYKWLLGPYSQSLAYLGPRIQESGVPLEETWTGREGSENFGGLVDYVDEYQPGALRFDMGERSNFWGTPALNASLDLLLEWTPAGISDYCRTLMADAFTTLESLGIRSEEEAFRSPHLFGLRFPDHVDGDAVKASLAKHAVNVSFRGSSIRVSPHVYNTPENVAALVRAVSEVS